jgi:hypothetical protein
VCRLLVTAKFVPSPPSLVTLLMEVLRSSVPPFLHSSVPPFLLSSVPPFLRRFLQEPHGVIFQKTLFHRQHRENLKSYIDITTALYNIYYIPCHVTSTRSGLFHLAYRRSTCWAGGHRILAGARFCCYPQLPGQLWGLLNLVGSRGLRSVYPGCKAAEVRI